MSRTSSHSPPSMWTAKSSGRRRAHGEGRRLMAVSRVRRLANDWCRSDDCRVVVMEAHADWLQAAWVGAILGIGFWCVRKLENRDLKK